MKESDVQKAILDYLAAERIFAFRINTATFKGEGRFFRSHSLGAGAADILALPVIRREQIFGSGIPDVIVDSFVPHWIEVKNTKGTQSAEQRSFQEYVEGLGHRYILARSVDDIREMWQERGCGK